VQQVAAAGEASRVFPLTRAWTTSNLHAGQFTAACGVEVYRGDLLGEGFYGRAFVCEPTGSLVHSETLTPAGATFTAKPATEGREFLATADSWFRPVNLELGPDGALYVVDMYRAVIEHPEFMPSELQQRPDLRLGDDRGRIYRIVPEAAKRPSETPALSKATTAELVALLGHRNAWWRDTASRLLYERQDAASVPLLEKLAATSTESTARTGALWALAGLNALTSEHLNKALIDSDARVREQAVVLGESHLEREQELRSAVVALATDDDARVRFRVALALGGVTDPVVVEALAQIAVQDARDPWTRRAVAAALPQLLDLYPYQEAKGLGRPEATRVRRGQGPVVGSPAVRRESAY